MESLSLGERIKRAVVTTSLLAIPVVAYLGLYSEYRSLPRADIDSDGEMELMCELSANIERAIGEGKYFVPSDPGFDLGFFCSNYGINPMFRVTEDGQFVSSGLRLEIDKVTNRMAVIDEDGNLIYEHRPLYSSARPWG